MKSLLLSNSNITLKKIMKHFSWIDKERIIGNLIIHPNNFFSEGWKLVNWYVAPGDYRAKVKITKDNNNYYMFLGANSGGSNPESISVGKEENGIYFLIREKFNNVYSDFPELSRRDLFILGEEQIHSDEELFWFIFNDLKNLSKEEKEYYDKVLEAIEIFGEYFSLQEININQVNDNHMIQKTLHDRKKE